MRRKILILACIIIVLCTTFSLVGCMELSEAVITYKADDNTAYLKKYEGISTEETITVQDEYQGKPVEKIGEFALANAEYLKVINIGKNVKEIDSWAFASSLALTAINVSDDNPFFNSVDGVLFNEDMTKLIAYPNMKATEYTVPNGVTEIGTNAFYKCKNLTKVVLPGTLKVISDRAFIKCGEIKTMDLPSGLTSIGMDGISYLSSLKYLFIPLSVTEIKDYALFGISGIEEVNFERPNRDGITFGKGWQPTLSGSFTKVPLKFNSVRKVA